MPPSVSCKVVCIVYLAVEGFSTVGVLDVPLGALLLYYLPHTMQGSTGRETGIGEEQGSKGSSQGQRSAHRHNTPSSRHDSSDEGKRGDTDIERNRDRGRERDSSVETAQVALPFCVVDVRWLLQLNEQSNSEESKGRETMNEEDLQGTSSRLGKKMSLAFGKGKNEDDTRSVYSTTSRKEEVLDSMQFLQNSVVIITKTYSKTRTVKHSRSTSMDAKRYHDFPHLPADVNNRRMEVGGWVGNRVRKDAGEEAQKEVGNNRRTPDDTISGFSGKIERDDVTDEDVSRTASRLDEEEVKEEVKEEIKLVGGTIYTCTLLGMYQRTLFFTALSLPSFLSAFFSPLRLLFSIPLLSSIPSYLFFSYMNTTASAVKTPRRVLSVLIRPRCLYFYS
jgi:hypothetical protein